MEKTNKALLNILDAAYNGQIQTNNDSLAEVITELNLRNLSEEEQIKFQDLKNKFYEKGIIFKDITKEKEQDSKIRLSSPDHNHEEVEDSERYIGLKFLIGIISVLGYIVILFGIMGFIYIIMQNNFGDLKNVVAFAVLIISFVFALPLLALSNLIHVFIDNESNTRKSHKLLKKFLEKI